MIAGARTPLTYVDPFGLVCLGLGRLDTRNHRPG